MSETVTVESKSDGTPIACAHTQLLGSLAEPAKMDVSADGFKGCGWCVGDVQHA
jgi:hypothetical protein